MTAHDKSVLDTHGSAGALDDGHDDHDHHDYNQNGQYATLRHARIWHYAYVYGHYVLCAHRLSQILLKVMSKTKQYFSS